MGNYGESSDMVISSWLTTCRYIYIYTITSWTKKHVFKILHHVSEWLENVDYNPRYYMWGDVFRNFNLKSLTGVLTVWKAQSYLASQKKKFLKSVPCYRLLSVKLMKIDCCSDNFMNQLTIISTKEEVLLQSFEKFTWNVSSIVHA